MSAKVRSGHKTGHLAVPLRIKVIKVTATPLTAYVLYPFSPPISPAWSILRLGESSALHHDWSVADWTPVHGMQVSQREHCSIGSVNQILKPQRDDDHLPGMYLTTFGPTLHKTPAACAPSETTLERADEQHDDTGVPELILYVILVAARSRCPTPVLASLGCCSSQTCVCC